ncbi:MAG: tetratricopeptide repeat protein [Chloroflexia bacterium]|nr:tetratricopeptide repeat protein [Chloroflexia bacterium]
MAGNRGIYNAAMKQAQAHAWKEKWSAALKEYQRAAEEFPEDLDARLGIAASYVGLQQWQEARQLYEKLQRAAPDNLSILERLAEVQVELNDLAAAKDSCFRLSDQYVVRRQLAQAIETLQHLSELLPQNEEVMVRLDRLYQESGDRSAAVQIRLEHVRLLFREERLGEAMVLAEQTLQLAPDSRPAKEMVFRLRREVAARKERGEEVGEISTEQATSRYQLEQWVREAMERQEQGDLDAAIQLYERAQKGGLQRADVCYSLGLICQERGERQKAVDQLQRSALDEEYALSSYYALGECYRDLGQMDQAAQSFERALHLVDLQSIGREAVDDLIRMYEATASVHEKRGDLARAASLYTNLSGFLQGKRWHRGRTDEFRQRAQELTEKSMFAKLRQLGTGILPAIEEHARGETREPLGEVDRPESAIPSLTEGTLRPITDFLRSGRSDSFQIEEAQSTAVVRPLEEALAIVPPVPMQIPVRELDTTSLEEPVRELVEVSRVYLERGLFNAALDACCEVIQRNPDYLAIHLRMAEVYERQDRPEMALAKYQTLISTYMAREEEETAVDVYQALLALSPDAVSSRSRLADLLIEMGRPQEAAQQMVQVAQNYFRLGQTNQAIETFRELRSLTPQDKSVYLEYGLFLLKMDRPEAAIAELRRALQLDPHDPLGLVRMNIALALLGEEKAYWDSLSSVLKRAEEEAVAREMEQEYKEIILFHEIPMLHYGLGLLQRQSNYVGEAIETLSRALQYFGGEPSDPLQLRLCRALAEGYLLLGQSQDAIQILQQGLAWAEILAPKQTDRDPHDIAAVPTLLSFYHWLAEAYTKDGQLEQAIAALRQAKDSYPFDRETCTKMADLHFRQGDLRQALAELSELVHYYEEQNQLDRALEILQHMNQLAPSNLSVRNRLSHLYIRRGYIDRGLEELESLAELQQKRGLIEEAVGSLQRMAEIFWTVGRHDRAYQVYDRITQLAPDDVSARQQLINLHILAGRLADALEEQRHIARITLQQRRFDDTIAALHQVIALDPDDSWALRQLADVLSSMGEHHQSARLYRRLSRLQPQNNEVIARLKVEEQLAQEKADGPAEN